MISYCRPLKVFETLRIHQKRNQPLLAEIIKKYGIDVQVWEAQGLHGPRGS